MGREEGDANEIAGLRTELAELKELVLQAIQPAGELLTSRQAATLAGISRSVMFRLIAKNDFPAGVKSGVGHSKKWRRDDVKRWVANRKPPRQFSKAA